VHDSLTLQDAKLEESEEDDELLEVALTLDIEVIELLDY